MAEKKSNKKWSERIKPLNEPRPLVRNFENEDLERVSRSSSISSASFGPAPFMANASNNPRATFSEFAPPSERTSRSGSIIQIDSAIPVILPTNTSTFRRKGLPPMSGVEGSVKIIEEKPTSTIGGEKFFTAEDPSLKKAERERFEIEKQLEKSLNTKIPEVLSGLFAEVPLKMDKLNTIEAILKGKDESESERKKLVQRSIDLEQEKDRLELENESMNMRMKSLEEKNKLMSERNQFLLSELASVKNKLASYEALDKTEREESEFLKRLLEKTDALVGAEEEVKNLKKKSEKLASSLNNYKGKVEKLRKLLLAIQERPFQYQVHVEKTPSTSEKTENEVETQEEETSDEFSVDLKPVVPGESIKGVYGKFMRVATGKYSRCLLFSFLDTHSILKVTNLTKATRECFKHEAIPSIIFSRKMKEEFHMAKKRIQELEAMINFSSIFEVSSNSMRDLLQKYIGGKLPHRVGTNLVQSLRNFSQIISTAPPLDSSSFSKAASDSKPGKGNEEKGKGGYLLKSLIGGTKPKSGTISGAPSQITPPAPFISNLREVETKMRNYLIVQREKNDVVMVEKMLEYLKENDLYRFLATPVLWEDFLSSSLDAKAMPGAPSSDDIIGIRRGDAEDLIRSSEYTLVELMEMADLILTLLDEHQKAVYMVSDSEKNMEIKNLELLRIQNGAEKIKNRCSEIEKVYITLRNDLEKSNEKMKVMGEETAKAKKSYEKYKKKHKENMKKLKVLAKEVNFL